MPGRTEHVAWGGLAGLGVGLVQRPGKSDAERKVEALAAFVGGIFGGRLPDILDPPTTCFHRRGAHSQPVGLALMLGLIKLIHDDVTRPHDISHSRQVDWADVVAKGLLKGAAAGYVSHLTLDAGTAIGLPPSW